MTKAALNILDDDEDGLFLMIEGGAVDWASHSNQPGRIIEEEIDFNNAVDAVVNWVKKTSNWGETLVIVTGDHETGYITGPDSGDFGEGPIWNPLINNGKGNLPGMEFHSKSHTNSLIPFYAKGRFSYMFKQISHENFDPIRGRYIDNTDIGKLILSLYC